MENMWGKQKESDRMKKISSSVDPIDPPQLLLVVKVPPGAQNAMVNRAQAGQEKPGTSPGWSLPWSLTAGSRFAASPCSPAVQGFRSGSGERSGGSLMGSHVHIPWMYLPRTGGSTAGPVCMREDGWSVPLTRGCTQNLLPAHSGQ